MQVLSPPLLSHTHTPTHLHNTLTTTLEQQHGIRPPVSVPEITVDPNERRDQTRLNRSSHHVDECQCVRVCVRVRPERRTSGPRVCRVVVVFVGGGGGRNASGGFSRRSDSRAADRSGLQQHPRLSAVSFMYI